MHARGATRSAAFAAGLAAERKTSGSVERVFGRIVFGPGLSPGWRTTRLAGCSRTLRRRNKLKTWLPSFRFGLDKHKPKVAKQNPRKVAAHHEKKQKVTLPY